MTDRLTVELLLEVALDLATAADDGLDEVLESALRRIGEAADIDRAYVITFDERVGRFSNTHEWCAAGVASHRAEIQNLPTEAFRWAADQLRRGEVVRWGEDGEVPVEAVEEIESFRRYGIRTVLEVPVRSDGELFADLGFNSRRDRHWTDREVEAVRRVADALAVRLALRRRVRDLEIDRGRLTERLETIGHELRTPLQRVILASEAAESGRSLPSQAVVALIQGTSELRAAVEALLGGTATGIAEEEVVANDARAFLTIAAGRLGAVADAPAHPDPIRFRGDPAAVEELVDRLSAAARGGRLELTERPPARIRFRWELPPGVDVDDVAGPGVLTAAAALATFGGHVSFAAGESLAVVVDLDAAPPSTVVLAGLGPEEARLLGAALTRQLDVVVVEGPDGRDEADVVVGTAEALAAHADAGRWRILVGDGDAPSITDRVGRPVAPADLVRVVRAVVDRG